MKEEEFTAIEKQDISFNDVFTVDEMQRLQDIFSEANDIASIITYPNGTPITNPSNFCRLCSDFIRNSDLGRCNCMESDATIGKHNPLGPTVTKCLSAGLWDAAVGITIGDVHVANWMIGQVRTQIINTERVREQAKELGVNPQEYLKAYEEVPVMSEVKFRKIADMLFAFVTEFSEKAYRNIQFEIESEKRKIAEQKRIQNEVELVRANEEIRIITENLPNIIWKADINLEGNLENTYISESADEIIGVPSGTIGNSFVKYYSYVVSEYRQKIKDTIALSMANPEQTFSYSYKVLKQNKEIAWFESTGRTYVIGEKVQIFGTTIDITKQKRIEDRLRQKEDLLEQAQKVADIGSYSLDIKTGEWISSINLDEIFGITDQYPKTVYGWLDIVYPEDREMMQDYLQNEVLIQNEAFNKEYRIKRVHNGEVIWVHGKGELELDKLNNPVSMIGTIQNINSRKQYDELLYKSEERYRSLLANLPVGVFRSTIEGEVISANPAMANIYGYNSLEELLSIEAPDYYTQLNPREEMMTALGKNGYLLDYKTQEYRQDGSLIWVSTNYKLVTNDDGEDYVDGVLMDITQRIKTENEIIDARAKAEESRERFELVMEVTLDGPYDWNLVTNEIYYSHRWKEILGYKPEEVPNDFSTWEKLTKPEDIKKSWDLLNKHIAGEIDKFEVEFKMKHKDGHWVDILSRAIAYFDEKGKAVRVVGTHIDISERKRAEKQLRENEERFRKLTEHLPSGIAIYRPVDNGNDFQFIDINKTAEKITNSTRDELVGHTLLNKFPNMAETPVYRALQKVNETGEDEFIPSFYYQDKVRDGWRENFIYKLQTGEIVVIFRDTTEVIAAEQNLQKQNAELTKAKLKAEQNETRFKALHNASFGGIAIHNKGTILDCNLGLSKISGFTHDELVGMDGLLLISEKSRKTVLDNILAEYEKPYEALGLRKNGEEYPVRLEGRSIPFKGIKARVVEFRDITEIKKAEHELILSKEKAEESDRLKSAFLANMSHEIRTPMNGILGFTSLLQEPGLTGEEQQTFIDIIQKSGDRMLNTVNDIIEISKIETGQINLLLKEINIKEHLDDLCNFFIPEAEKKGLNLILRNELLDNEIFIKSDELKLSSILTNLIKNAIKYSQKGTITVLCKRLNDQLLFTVKDTGIGIPSNRLKAIFERFVQADIDDRHVHEGSGLGLAITKSYVEMLGGEIWVESEENKGSTFSFLIDYSKLELNKTAAVENNTEFICDDLKEVNVLIAEDDDVSFLLVESILSSQNWKFVRAKNGVDAIEICKSRNDLDLILMDIKMPRMDGIEATKEIRTFNKDIPIIAQTAYALEGDKEMVMEAGCNDYLSKPINQKELISKLDNILRNEG